MNFIGIGSAVFFGAFFSAAIAGAETARERSRAKDLFGAFIGRPPSGRKLGWPQGYLPAAPRRRLQETGYRPSRCQAAKAAESPASISGQSQRGRNSVRSAIRDPDGSTIRQAFRDLGLASLAVLESGNRAVGILRELDPGLAPDHHEECRLRRREEGQLLFGR